MLSSPFGGGGSRPLSALNSSRGQLQQYANAPPNFQPFYDQQEAPNKFTDIDQNALLWDRNLVNQNISDAVAQARQPEAIFQQQGMFQTGSGRAVPRGELQNLLNASQARGAIAGTDATRNWLTQAHQDDMQARLSGQQLQLGVEQARADQTLGRGNLANQFASTDARRRLGAYDLLSSLYGGGSGGYHRITYGNAMSGIPPLSS